MKSWIMLLFLMGQATLGFAQYGSSSGQNYNPYQSGGGSQSYGQSGSPCDGQHLSANEKAFSQQLSPIHQNVFCGQFTASQRQQAMSLAGSATQNMKGESGGSITPDMAVEIVMQTARYNQQHQGSAQQQQPYQGQQRGSYSYPNQGQSSSGGRYSNY